MEQILMSNLAEQIRGVSYKPGDLHDSLDENSVTLLRANNIGDGLINFDDIVYVDKRKVSAGQYLRKGDILICASSGSKNLVGKAAQVQFDGEYTFGAFCKVVRPTRISADFLGMYFQSPTYRNLISNLAQGANINNIKNEHIDMLVVNVPEENERQTITQILDKVISVIRVRREELQKLDDLIKARFVEMFGDPVHNGNRLPTKKLADLGSLDRGRSKHRPRNAPELLGGPYPLIQTGEIASAGLYITSYQNTYSELGLQQSKMWDAGTLCITIAANIAQTAILTFDACFPDSVVGFIPYGEVTAVYMHYWFGFFQKILEEQAPQVAQKNINLAILSDLDVMVPPRQQQLDFLAFVEQTDKSKVVVQKALDEAQTLFDSLMQEYFE